MAKTDQVSRTASDFVNVKEAAIFTTLSEVSIRRFLTQKRLTRYKIGGRTLIRRSQLLSLIIAE